VAKQQKRRTARERYNAQCFRLFYWHYWFCLIKLNFQKRVCLFLSSRGLTHFVVAISEDTLFINILQESSG